MLLRAEREFIAFDAELAQQLAERSPPDTRRHEIGHRMQPYIVFATVHTVEAVESPGRIMPLENADPPAEMGEPDAGGKAGHAGTNDGDVVVAR